MTPTPPVPSPSSRSGALTRRGAIGAGFAALAVPLTAQSAAAAPSYTPIPLLTGEVSRTDTRTTRLGKKPYECIDVVINGDRARIFVPQTAIPNTQTSRATTAVGVIWFYHSYGSDHTSLDGAYKYGAEMCVDQGTVCICPTYGGTGTWTNAAAVALQKTWSTYITNVWRVGVSFARGNSGGGSLMCWAYGNNMLQAQRGVYLANATYDMESLYAQSPGDVGPAYNNDPAAIAATNPARLPQSAWQGKRLKTVVSRADFVVPPDKHGLALAALAQPVATDVRIQYHDQGHIVPSWTQQDMVSTFGAWMP